jgi:hypothetical protein
MARDITIPSQTIKEEIVVVEELVNQYVRVVVGVLNEDGKTFNTNMGVKEYRIVGNNLAELNGPPTAWSPDKPTGTYRNEDLWHFIDLLNQS